MSTETITEAKSSAPSIVGLTPNETDRIRRDPPERLSLTEAAAYLSLAPKTVSNLLKTRQLKGIKVGRNWIITRKNLRSFIDA